MVFTSADDFSHHPQIHSQQSVLQLCVSDVVEGWVCNCCQCWSQSVSGCSEAYYSDLKMALQLNVCVFGRTGCDRHVCDSCHKDFNDIAVTQHVTGLSSAAFPCHGIKLEKTFKGESINQSISQSIFLTLGSRGPVGVHNINTDAVSIAELFQV